MAIRKDKGVITNVSSDYYRMMERTRIILQRRYNIKVKSNIELTRLMASAPPIYENRKWIRKIKQNRY